MEIIILFLNHRFITEIRTDDETVTIRRGLEDTMLTQDTLEANAPFDEVNTYFSNCHRMWVSVIPEDNTIHLGDDGGKRDDFVCVCFFNYFIFMYYYYFFFHVCLFGLYAKCALDSQTNFRYVTPGRHSHS